jgi:hypothetical protein
LLEHTCGLYTSRIPKPPWLRRWCRFIRQAKQQYERQLFVSRMLVPAFVPLLRLPLTLPTPLRSPAVSALSAVLSGATVLLLSHATSRTATPVLGPLAVAAAAVLLLSTDVVLVALLVLKARAARRGATHRQLSAGLGEATGSEVEAEQRGCGCGFSSVVRGPLRYSTIPGQASP